MTGVVVLALFIVALVLAIIDEANNQGRAILTWAVIALAVGLLVSRLG